MDYYDESTDQAAPADCFSEPADVPIEWAEAPEQPEPVYEEPVYEEPACEAPVDEEQPYEQQPYDALPYDEQPYEPPTPDESVYVAPYREVTHAASVPSEMASEAPTDPAPSYAAPVAAQPDVVVSNGNSGSIMLDTNADGVADWVALDTNGDGIVDDAVPLMGTAAPASAVEHGYASSAVIGGDQGFGAMTITPAGAPDASRNDSPTSVSIGGGTSYDGRMQLVEELARKTSQAVWAAPNYDKDRLPDDIDPRPNDPTEP